MANSLTTKNLQGFKTRLKGGGARPNLFEVSIPHFQLQLLNQVKLIGMSAEIMNLGSFVKLHNFLLQQLLKFLFLLEVEF